MSKDDPFLEDTSVKTLRNPRKSTHLILWITVAFIIIGVVWANFTMIDEVTRGEGKVIPSSQVQVIQNLEGGIIEKIYVKEGEIVQKGQKLVKMDATRFQTSYDEDRLKSLALKIKMERLIAEMKGVDFVPSPELMKYIPDVVDSEIALFKSRKEQLLQLQINLDLATKELNLTAPLVSKGAVSQVEVIRLNRDVSQLKGQMDDFKSKALTELNETISLYNSSKQSALANEDKLNRTVILSPVKGIVKQIKITTIGGVSQPGADIMEIVPLEDTLLIESKVQPKDIGFIHIGQPAIIKIAAYDFSIYGGLKGKVESISADTLTDEKGVSYFLIRVRTQKNYLRNKDNALYIIPGMTATMEILTGKKSVLHYLLKPLMKARENALTER
ncbi:MAG: HlyD family type I secretion periplasmic adaptor subunit [Legionella sp.]|nr:MAG: HlyD family type I secretion periplasmic adaptor subunit [Legionella sp.]